MKFNENLRNLRREKDLSQEALAIDMNVSRQTISKWENGTAMPDLKKLTELAEYFSVSMDTLLGTAVEKDGGESAENGGADNDNLKQYINDLLAYSEANQQAQNKKTVKTFYIFTVVIIVVFVFVLVSTYNNLSDKINSLSQSLFNLQMDKGNYYGDYVEDNGNYISSRVVSLGKDKPYVARMHFEYSPESYPKNGEVYFLIPQKEGDAVKAEAVLENGVFTADADVDITLDKEIYLCIDDSDTVEKKEVSANYAADCIEITVLTSPFAEVNVEYNTNTKTIDFDTSFTIDSMLYLRKGTEGKFTSAKLVATHNGEEKYTKELTVKERTPDRENRADYIVEIPSVSFSLPYNGYSENEETETLYISVTDELGVEYRYYPCIGGDSFFNFGMEEHCELIFNTDSGKAVISDITEY